MKKIILLILVLHSLLFFGQMSSHQQFSRQFQATAQKTVYDMQQKRMQTDLQYMMRNAQMTAESKLKKEELNIEKNNKKNSELEMDIADLKTSLITASDDDKSKIEKKIAKIESKIEKNNAIVKESEEKVSKLKSTIAEQQQKIEQAKKEQEAKDEERKAEKDKKEVEKEVLKIVKEAEKAAKKASKIN